MSDMGFVLIFMVCSGHTNAECWWEHEYYSTKQECVEEMNRVEEWSSWIGKGERRAYSPKKTMCIFSDAVVFGEEE